MSGEEACIPEKKATPRATMKKMERNLALLLRISIQNSLCIAFIFFTYHSISSTGVGCAFCVIWDTFPFLIRITLSAMGVSAEL